MRNIFILTLNDLCCALKNKTFYLIFFIPLFVFAVLNFVDRAGQDPGKVKLVLSHNLKYPADLLEALAGVNRNVEVKWVGSEEEGPILLKQNKADGFLQKGPRDSVGLTLLVLRSDSPQTLLLAQLFTTLKKSGTERTPGWISEVKSIRETDIRKRTLPIWILTIVLLVAFVILPAQVADEKERQLFLGLLQTPIHEVQWLISKMMLALVLIGTAILLIHSLHRLIPINSMSYLSLILTASFCFGSFGIFLGLLCHNQASARTLGLIFYLPLLVPTALSDFSQKSSDFLPLLPSYQFYGLLPALLFEEAPVLRWASWTYLLLLGLALFVFSHLLMKRRWLM